MRIILICVGAAVVLTFLLPIIMRVHNLGMAAGIAWGILCCATGVFWNKMGATAQKYIAFAIFIVFVAAYFIFSAIMQNGKTTAENERVLIVLGCRVRGDEPSVALQKRVDSAYFFLLTNPDSIAILSGGQGRDENLSEAQCMKNMLTDRGVSPSRLFLEEQSTSTEQNIKFSKRIIESNNFPTDVAVATSEYHQLRSKMICKKYGLNASAVSSKTQPLLLPTFLLREAMAIVNEKIKR